MIRISRNRDKGPAAKKNPGSETGDSDHKAGKIEQLF